MNKNSDCIALGKKTILFFQKQVVVSLILFLFLSLQGVYIFAQPVVLNNPEDGFVTFESQVLFGWNDYEGNVSYELRIFSEDGELIFNYNVTELYYHIDNLLVGNYYWDVRVWENDSIKALSEEFELVRLELPDSLDVEVDLLEYASTGFVRLVVNAPLGSEVYMRITGSDEPITYNPSNLQNREWYVKLEKAGTYNLYVNMSYKGIYDDFTKEFDLPSLEDTSDTSDTSEDDTITHEVMILSYCDDREELSDVLVRAKTSSKDEVIQTNNEGFVMLSLEQGDYEFEFSKEGYETKSQSVVIDESRTIRVYMDRESVSDDVRAAASTNRDKYSVLITSPSQDGTFVEGRVDIEYLTDQDAEDCSLMLKKDQRPGWEVLDGEYNTIYGDRVYSDRFSLMNASPGEYALRMKCQDEDHNYGQSQIVYITVYEKKPDVSEINVALKSTLDELQDMLDDLTEPVINGLDTVGILDLIFDIEKRALVIEDNIEKRVDDLSKAEILSQMKAAQAQIDLMKEQLPASIELSSKRDFISYMPHDSFDEVLFLYLEADYLLDDEDKRSYRRHLKSFQEKFYFETTHHVVSIAFDSGKMQTYTIITKEIKLSDDELSPQELTIIEYVPYSITDQPIYFSEQVTPFGSDFFRLEEGVMSYTYVIDDLVSYEDIKKSHTIALGDIERSSLITGFAVLDRFGVGSGLIPYTLLVILLGVFGIMLVARTYAYSAFAGNKISGQLFSGLAFEASDKNSSSYEKIIPLLEEVVAITEQQGISSTLSYYSQMLDLYEQLTEEQKESVKPFVEKLGAELRSHSVCINIADAKRNIEEHKRMFGYQPELYMHIYGYYKKALNDYHQLPEQYKMHYYDDLNKMADDIAELKKRKKEDN